MSSDYADAGVAQLGSKHAGAWEDWPPPAYAEPPWVREAREIVAHGMGIYRIWRRTLGYSPEAATREALIHARRLWGGVAGRY